MTAKFVHDPAFREAPLRALLRVAEWRVRCWLGRPVVIPWPAHEPLRMVLPPVWTNAYVATFVFRGIDRDDRELTWVIDRLERGAIFVDVGANLGQWTVPVARQVGPDGRVLAIEPAAATAAALAQSIRVNGLTQAEVLRIAVSEHDGTALLHHHHRDPTQNSLGDVGSATEEVRTRTLDSLLIEHQVDQLDAVKMDVEGAEELVLRGSTMMLSVLRPTIIFEVRKGLPERMDLEPDGAWRMLIDAGYRSYRFADEGPLQPAAPEDLAGQVSGWNIIALPAENAAAATRVSGRATG